jgi:flagellar protein FliS
MNPFRTPSALAYRDVGLVTSVDGASPHRLIMMLLDGAVAAVADARQHIRTRNMSAKCASISRAIAIIGDGLRMSLDMERGGSIAVQLQSLYDYMMRRLVEANATNSQDLLAEVSSLLCEIRAAWAQIGERPAAAAVATLPASPQERRAVSYGAA